MLNMFENKRRTTTILILILLAAGIVFYILYSFVFNKGIVVFESHPPFEIAFGNINQMCESDKCEFQVPVGEYRYIVSKTGYNQNRGTVRVKRGEVHVIKSELYYIPEISDSAEYNTYILPAGYGNYTHRLLDISLFAEIPESYQLMRLPKRLKDIRFSPSGKFAIIFGYESVLFYSTEEFTSRELALRSGAGDAAWVTGEQSFYTITYDEDNKKHALANVEKNTFNVSNMIYFDRDIADYDIQISPNESFVSIIDRTRRGENLYIVDLNEARRANVFGGNLIEGGRWSDDGSLYVFSARESVEPFASIWVLKTEDNSIRQLPFRADINNLDFFGRDLYFVTDHSYMLSTTNVPYISTFKDEEIHAELITDLIFEEQASDNIALHRWSFENDESYLLMRLADNVTYMPAKIEISSDGKKIRILVGDKYYDIKIAE